MPETLLKSEGAMRSSPDANQGLSPMHWASALVVATVLAYGPAFADGYGYIWDDGDYVVNNSNLKSVRGLTRIWLVPKSSPQYYPLVHTSYWLEYRLWDLWPTGYHATNIFLHAASAVLLWRLLLLLEIPGAWLAAAVFALHPVHVESVAWITERKNTLSLLFYLAAALCFFRQESSRQASSSHRWLLYLASLGFFLAALLCKTVTATLPCALLVVLWWKHGTLSLRQVASVAPMLVLAVPLGMHTAFLEREHVRAIGPEWDFSLPDRCLIAGRAVWFYAQKLLMPYPLIFMYPRWEIDDRDWRQYLYPLAACALLAALWLMRKRIGRGPLAAALFFGGTLFPALGFFNVYPMKYSFVADHFQYAASIGLITLFASLASSVALAYCHPAVARLLAVGLLSVLAALTWQQSRIYRNQETLWRDTLAKNPQCEMAYVNLGHWLQSEGRFQEAVESYQQAIKLTPNDPDRRINLAMAYADLQDLEQAERILNEAIPLDPSHALTFGNLATVKYRKKQLEEAEKLFQQAIKLDPDDNLIRFNYGNLLVAQRRPEEAQVQYEQVVARSPDSVAVRFNLAVLLLKRGNHAAAIAQLEEVLRRDPSFPDAQELLWQAKESRAP